jgi:SpoVK/Ycf46/Vps4 family AAA+-type ATPase
MDHFKYALSIVKPSNLNEFSSKIPDITFGDLFGIDDIIQEIKTSVIQPFHHPENYIELGISPPKGILVHGPTGVGKTMLCSALASEAGVNFMLVESSQIRSKVVGESEKGIAKLFAQARANSPCILFIDQVKKRVLCLYWYFYAESIVD